MEEKRIKYFSNEVKAVDDKKRVLRFVGSNEKVDRDNEIIKASGWKLANYKKNPVVLINHQHHDLPVAKAKKVWVDGKSLMFDIEFPEADVNPQGDTIYKLYKNGYMKATSVGFIPNMEKAVFGKKKGDPNITFNEQELLELSLVSVPANPSALLTSKGVLKAVKDEVIEELELKDLETWFEEHFEEITEEKDEKEEISVNTEKDSENHSQEDIKDISNSESEEKVCDECGVKITLCSSCLQKDQDENFFKKVYESLLDD